MDNRFKSHIKIYLLIWILILSLIIIFKSFFHESMNLVLYYAVITWVPAMIINGFEGRRLMNYVKENYSDKHMEMKSLNGIDGVHNGFASLGFLFSTDDDSDEVLGKLKSNYKKVILLLITLFFSYPIMLLIIMYS